MRPKALAVLMAASLPFCARAFGQAASSAQPRHITLHEAVELALKHKIGRAHV